MNKTIKLILFLAVVSAISGLSIGLVNNVTAPIIEQNAIAAEKANLELIYPGATFVSIDVKDDKGVVTGGYKVEGKGYIFKATAKGYNSSNPIVALVGLDEDGVVTNVVALEQSETNGVGTKCFEEANINSLYVGVTPGDEIDILSGATFTSNAMKTIISRSQEIYMEVK